MDLSKHAFFEGKIVPLSDAKINIATHGFLYGTAVFGGMRAYWNEEKKRLFVFRPYDHFRRLLHSARMLTMQTSYDEESLIQLTLDVLRTDDWHQDVYMRPTFYKSDMGIGVRLHDLKDEFCMFTMPFEKYVKNDSNAHVTISSWRRIDDNMIPAQRQGGRRVCQLGADQDRCGAGRLRRGAGARQQRPRLGRLGDEHLHGARRGADHAAGHRQHPGGHYTRGRMIELARNELGLPVVERSIDRTEVFIAEEFFMTGTAAEVTAVTKIDYRPVGAGKMGPITTKLRALYEDVIRARNPKYSNWNVEV